MHGLPLALVLALKAAPTYADVLRLDDVERRALRAHPQLQSQDARIQRARAQEELARSARRPNIAGRVDGTLAPGGDLITVNADDVAYLVQGSRTIDDPRAFVPQFRYSAGIGATATLYDFGRSNLQIEAAQAQVRAEGASVDQVKLKVVLDVRDAYTGWLQAGESARIADEQLARLQEWRSKIEQLIKEGARPSSDAALARYEEQRAQLAALRARSARDLALVTLEAAAQTDLPDDASADAALLEQSDQPNSARADEQLPASKALERQRQAALLGARALDKGHAPVLSGSAEVGVRGQESEIFPVYRVSVGLTVPIWDGGEQSARAAMARADAEELSAGLAQARRAESDQQRLARTQSEQSEQALKLALQVQAAAQTLLDQAVERYQLGGGGIEPVLDAQHTLADAELEVLGTRLARLQATLRLRPAPAGS
ncbi:MAG: TolC family protein [Polyangiaceae bacterium]